MRSSLTKPVLAKQTVVSFQIYFKLKF